MTDSQLLEQSSSGNRDAFRVLYDRYRPKVYSYALRITLSPELAEDIVHDVFLKLWNNGGMEVENVVGFLRVVTRNHTLKILRKQVLEERVAASAAIQQPACHSCTDDAIAYQEARETLFGAIARLSPQRKQVFLLCKDEGLKYEEVAQRMNLSPLTVKTHMQHALRFLRKYMERYSGVVLAVAGLVWG